MGRERFKGVRYDAGSLSSLCDQYVARERERHASRVLTKADWSFIANAREAFEKGGMTPAEVELRISALTKRLIDKIKGVPNG